MKINSEVIKNIVVSYPYGKSAMTPFMFLFSKVNSVEYSLYLTIGTNGPEVKDLDLLRGFFVKSDIGDDQYGEIKSQHYPVEFRKIKPTR